MTENPDTRKRRSDGWGPVSGYVSENLKRLRKVRGLTTTALSEALADEKIGHSIPASGITRIEKGDRRVDVDDLVALALVLNVSPLTLLLPDDSSQERVNLTKNFEVAALTAWQWGEGQRTAMDYMVGPTANFGPDGDPAFNAEAYERERVFERQQDAYTALARPRARQRAANHPAIRVLRGLWELIEDIVAPEPEADRSVLAARGRSADRAYVKLGLDLEEMIEQLPPVHPGMPMEPGEGRGQS